MNDFRFDPELFSYREQALNALNDLGYEWFTHFTAIDLLHDVYGLEVCGITEKTDALKIKSILRRTLTGWRYSWIGYNDGERDRGWKVVIHRDAEDKSGSYSEA